MFKPSHMTSNSNQKEVIEVITGRATRKRWTPAEKRAFVEETYLPGVSVSSVARKHGLAPSQLFSWRNLMEAGALAGVGSEERVVPESEVKQLRHQIRELERMLGKQSMQNEVLKEAIRIGREKKLISRAPLSGVDDFE
jgi:transposase